MTALLRHHALAYFLATPPMENRHDGCRALLIRKGPWDDVVSYFEENPHHLPELKEIIPHDIDAMRCEIQNQLKKREKADLSGDFLNGATGLQSALNKNPNFRKYEGYSPEVLLLQYFEHNPEPSNEDENDNKDPPYLDESHRDDLIPEKLHQRTHTDMKEKQTSWASLEKEYSEGSPRQQNNQSVFQKQQLNRYEDVRYQKKRLEKQNLKIPAKQFQAAYNKKITKTGKKTIGCANVNLILEDIQSRPNYLHKKSKLQHMKKAEQKNNQDTQSKCQKMQRGIPLSGERDNAKASYSNPEGCNSNKEREQRNHPSDVELRKMVIPEWRAFVKDTEKKWRRRLKRSPEDANEEVTVPGSEIWKYLLGKPKATGDDEDPFAEGEVDQFNELEAKSRWNNEFYTFKYSGFRFVLEKQGSNGVFTYSLWAEKDENQRLHYSCFEQCLQFYELAEKMQVHAWVKNLNVDVSSTIFLDSLKYTVLQKHTDVPGKILLSVLENIISKYFEKTRILLQDAASLEFCNEETGNADAIPNSTLFLEMLGIQGFYKREGYERVCQESCDSVDIFRSMTLGNLSHEFSTFSLKSPFYPAFKTCVAHCPGRGINEETAMTKMQEFLKRVSSRLSVVGGSAEKTLRQYIIGELEKSRDTVKTSDVVGRLQKMKTCEIEFLNELVCAMEFFNPQMLLGYGSKKFILHDNRVVSQISTKFLEEESFSAQTVTNGVKFSVPCGEALQDSSLQIAFWRNGHWVATKVEDTAHKEFVENFQHSNLNNFIGITHKHKIKLNGMWDIDNFGHYRYVSGDIFPFQPDLLKTSEVEVLRNPIKFKIVRGSYGQHNQFNWGIMLTEIAGVSLSEVELFVYSITLRTWTPSTPKWVNRGWGMRVGSSNAVNELVKVGKADELSTEAMRFQEYELSINGTLNVLLPIDRVEYNILGKTQDKIRLEVTALISGQSRVSHSSWSIECIWRSVYANWGEDERAKKNFEGIMSFCQYIKDWKNVKSGMLQKWPDERPPCTCIEFRFPKRKQGEDLHIELRKEREVGSINFGSTTGADDLRKFFSLEEEEAVDLWKQLRGIFVDSSNHLKPAWLVKRGELHHFIFRAHLSGCRKKVEKMDYRKDGDNDLDQWVQNFMYNIDAAEKITSVNVRFDVHKGQSQNRFFTFVKYNDLPAPPMHIIDIHNAATHTFIQNMTWQGIVGELKKWHSSRNDACIFTLSKKGDELSKKGDEWTTGCPDWPVTKIVVEQQYAPKNKITQDTKFAMLQFNGVQVDSEKMKVSLKEMPKSKLWQRTLGWDDANKGNLQMLKKALKDANNFSPEHNKVFELTWEHDKWTAAPRP